MVGAMSGGEEPEWSEETAWDSLRDIVRWEFAQPNEEGVWTITRSLANPARVFALALTMAAHRQPSPPSSACKSPATTSSVTG